MSLTQDGLGVADGIRGNTFEHSPGEDSADGAAIQDVHVDGFAPRNSGRPDLYPDAPMHYRSAPQQPATGRLDEVTAPEPEPAPEAPVGIQIPPLRPAPRLPAAPPASPAAGASAPAAAE